MCHDLSYGRFLTHDTAFATVRVRVAAPAYVQGTACGLAHTGTQSCFDATEHQSSLL